MSSVTMTFPQKLNPIAPSPTCWLCLVDTYKTFYKLCDFPVPWESWCNEVEQVGQAGIVFSITRSSFCRRHGATLKRTWVGQCGCSCHASVILAWVEQEHGWVLGFPHSFLLLELRGYSNSPASWSRVIGLFSQSPPATPVQDLQDWFDSTSLMFTPLVF